MTVTPIPSSRVWTVPNVISMMRIVLIGVFVYLMANEHDVWAFATLAAAGISDFLDGFLARRWNQVTELGRILGADVNLSEELRMVGYGSEIERPLNPRADRLLAVLVG